jgi:hypothetical protein
MNNVSVPSLDLSNVYRQAIPSSARTYGESLVKSFTGNENNPITENDYTPEELSLLKDLIQKNYDKKMQSFTNPKKIKEMINFYENQRKQTEYDQKHGWAVPKEVYEKNLKETETRLQQYKDAIVGKVPSDFMFDYTDYGPEAYKTNEKEQLTTDMGKASPLNLRNTFGKFRYKIDPKTKKINIYDTYDFSNPSRQESVDKYAKMSAFEKAKESGKAFIGGDRAALGEAYLGTKKIPVSINLDMNEELINKYLKAK